MLKTKRPKNDDATFAKLFLKTSKIIVNEQESMILSKKKFQGPDNNITFLNIFNGCENIFLKIGHLILQFFQILMKR